MFIRLFSGVVAFAAGILLLWANQPAELADGDGPVAQWQFESGQFSGGLLAPTAGKWSLRIQGEPQWDKQTGSAHFSGGMDLAILEIKKKEPAPKTGPESLSAEAWVRLDCGSRKGGLISMVDDNRHGGQGFSLGYDEDRFRFGLATEGARKGGVVL